MDVHIEWFDFANDAKKVMEIERVSYCNPMSFEKFRDLCCNRNTIVMNAIHRGVIVGYVMYSLHADRVQILNLTVASGYRRQGVGRALLAKVKNKLNATRTRLEMIVHNAELRAQFFLRGCGMTCIRENDQTNEMLFSYSLVATVDETSVEQQLRRLQIKAIWYRDQLAALASAAVDAANVPKSDHELVELVQDVVFNGTSVNETLTKLKKLLPK